MPLHIYNTLSRKKEVFHPLHKKWVGLYTCGPTVYDFVHLGNLRTYIFQDILKRALEYAHYKVRHIMNITDVDDKTIRYSQKAGETLRGFTRKYEKIFKEDLKKINVEFPKKFTRATEHISEMIKMTASLLRKGYAYKKNGSVYFDISQFKNYGKLARLDKKGLKAGARVDTDEYAKDEARDFALWKAAKPGEPSWPSPFGRGRPGWHIECSAMSTKYLSQPLDLHTAAVDLIFPHHENEIAQSEAAYGKKFVNFWVHGEHLLVNGEKMSKSLGNIFALRDVEAKNFDPLAFRYLILTSHYRSKINFTWESLRAAQNSLERLYDFAADLRMAANHHAQKRSNVILKYKKRFQEAIYDDLNTARALSVLWDLIHDYHKTPGEFSAQDIKNLIYEFDKVLGLNFKKAARTEKIPPSIRDLIDLRGKYRKTGDWLKADRLRKKIHAQGFIVEDTTAGPRIKKL